MTVKEKTHKPQKSVEESDRIAEEWIDQQACPRCSKNKYNVKWQWGSKTSERGWKLRCCNCNAQAIKSVPEK